MLGIVRRRDAFAIVAGVTPRMRPSGLAPGSVVALLVAFVGCHSLAGCNANVTVPSTGAGGEGGQGGEGIGGATSRVSSGALAQGGGGAGGFDDIVDPGCENPPPPLRDFACDPYAQGNGDCAPGEGCLIYVQYPSEPCGQEIYGSTCAPVGTGVQGESCFGAQDCAAGFVCVVSGAGNQCVELCPLDGSVPCPVGLVCEPIDVEGFGGCI